MNRASVNQRRFLRREDKGAEMTKRRLCRVRLDQRLDLAERFAVVGGELFDELLDRRSAVRPLVLFGPGIIREFTDERQDRLAGCAEFRQDRAGAETWRDRRDLRHATA